MKDSNDGNKLYQWGTKTKLYSYKDRAWLAWSFRGYQTDRISAHQLLFKVQFVSNSLQLQV